MPWSPEALVVASTALRSAVKGVQLHTGDPGIGASANRSSAAPKAPNLGPVDSSGDFNLATPLQFTGCTRNGPIRYISLWSGTNLGAATWYGNVALTGDQTADSYGNYTLESLVSNTSSS
ncbi:hypothetical protein ABW16_21595 [Mycolicibacter heraklionensis]|uniref:Uncharacterized protein n=1 Tax=Mycolicibacter heraklionensis TaxID=512402 RepID=A0ABR5FA75_9MYCO|nr:hypothetical protein [Mycolicibacter heraklionensis]KLO25906.1 hypothetical protein ABW16_21595 [Mycolicibacter heraklionensis]